VEDSILSSGETREQIVQICRAGEGSESAIPSIEWCQARGFSLVLAMPGSCTVARRLPCYERKGTETLQSGTEALR